MDRLQLLRELTEAPGVPGYERPVRDVIRRHMAGLAEMELDGIGSLICRKEGDSARPRVMLAGHMDEIGFMVTLIGSDGFVRFRPLGGWWGQVMMAQRVVIKTRSGDVIGVVGSKPPHILSEEDRKKVFDRADMYIDVGAASAEEARDTFGIRPGDPIIPESSFAQMSNPKMLLAKAWDCRIGCALFMETIAGLQGMSHPNTVYGVGTVQEEVGLRGATTSAYLVEPDVALALEAGIAGDTPGVKATEAQERLGEGPVIGLLDNALIPNLKLRDLVAETAAELSMPVQFDVMNGSTDAGRIHLSRAGVPSLVLMVPCRYVHSHSGIIHLDDYEETIQLLLAVIGKLDADRVRWLRTD